jgi:hypothetical protein
MKVSYTYTILRYVHDPATGEFANVGVVLFAPEAKFARAFCRDTFGRLAKIFPGMNGETFKSLMRYIESRIDEIGGRLQAELPLEKPPVDALALASQVLPHDDSSLQWSPLGSGLSERPSETLERLFERFVTRYDEKPLRPQRDEAVIWRSFKRNFDVQQVTALLRPKKISVADDEVEFECAYKNEQWHCLEPVSFDLANADSITDKAHRWLGQIASVRLSPEAFKVYFLVGAPQQTDLLPAYNKAMSILRKVPVDQEIIPEEQAQNFAAHIAGMIKAHERGLPSGG